MSQNYRFTVNGGHFTDEQRDFYETNGYIVFRNLIPEKDLQEFTQRFLEICRGHVKVYGLTIMKDKGIQKTDKSEEEYQIFKIQDFTFDDFLFEKYARNKDLVNVVTSIVGPNVTTINTMIINKPPNSTDVFAIHPTHQDLFYFPFRPADSVCASWTAMEKCTKQNGCLFVVPGSHRNQLLPHVYLSKTKNKSYQGIENVQERSKLYLDMEAGDTVFFHPLLLHGSGPNMTQGFRKAISAHFIDSNCFFIDVRGSLQEAIEREVEEIYAKKGIIAKYSDIWKYKSRLVTGRPGNFQTLASVL
ncbi:phytanoyl-CoA dioxygenase, peroxisomal-like [Atheta coriaria]|uniref:phytanoyl-CoA dioxygenase, peroxisomal-like n=1 Tax=Dalotia coriaria TaxID=877792 RepID=UPI0031F3D2EB